MARFVRDLTRDDVDSGWQMSFIQMSRNYYKTTWRKELHNKKPDQIQFKKKFDAESAWQKKIRDIRNTVYSGKRLPPKQLPVYSGGTISSIPKLTNDEWLHKYNLEPHKNFHYEDKNNLKEIPNT